MKNTEKTLQKEESRHPKWMDRVQLYLLRGRKQKALNYLEKIIGSFLPLFPDDKEVMQTRRLAWMTRIDILREWGKDPEALAWICLECELNQDNIEAQALRRRMMNTLNLAHQLGTSTTPLRSYGRFEWKGVAGMRLLKAQLEREVLLPVLEKDLYELYKVPLPNGILLYGPPGCGKTYIARKLAHELGYFFLDIKPSDLASPWVHGGQELIGKTFKQALENAPTVLLFDEIDALVPSRKDLMTHHYRAEVNEFLAQLDNASERGILIIGTTNYMESIDDAVLRPGRFDKIVHVGNPDLEAREELLRLFMAGRPADSIDYLSLAQSCNGLTPAELRLTVDDAARSALSNRVLISNEHLQAQITGSIELRAKVTVKD